LRLREKRTESGKRRRAGISSKDSLLLDEEKRTDGKQKNKDQPQPYGYDARRTLIANGQMKQADRATILKEKVVAVGQGCPEENKSKGHCQAQR